MLWTEWSTEDAIAYAREEGREDGREEGRVKGREEGIETGRENERKYVLELLEQGLSLEEIKFHLTQTANNK